MAIRVNIFSRRVRSDVQPRSKKGQPHQRTTGVAKANWIQFDIWPGMNMWRLARCPPISRAKTGRVRTRPTQKRLVKSISSWLGGASAVTVSGSSAMPQIGQEPGPSCRISGCIGQV